MKHSDAVSLEEEQLSKKQIETVKLKESIKNEMSEPSDHQQSLLSELTCFTYMQLTL